MQRRSNSVIRQLFLQTGRIDRKSYWCGVMTAACVFIPAIKFGVTLHIDDRLLLAAALFEIFYASLGWLLGRRFADIGLSPWWGWGLIILSLTYLTVIIVTVFFVREPPYPDLVVYVIIVLNFISLGGPILVGFFVGLLRGAR